MKTTQKELRDMIAFGVAINIEKVPESEWSEIRIHRNEIAIAKNQNGICGFLIHDKRTGKLYACATRSSAIHYFL